MWEGAGGPAGSLTPYNLKVVNENHIQITDWPPYSPDKKEHLFVGVVRGRKSNFGKLYNNLGLEFVEGERMVY